MFLSYVTVSLLTGLSIYLIEIKNNNCIFQTFTLYIERTRKNQMKERKGYTCMDVVPIVCTTSREKEKKQTKDL